MNRNEAALKKLLESAQRDMFPKMEQSLFVLVIACEAPDAKIALEIGAAVLLDKPLLIVVPKGRTISPGLRRIARSIVEVDCESPEAREQIRKAVRDMGVLT